MNRKLLLLLLCLLVCMVQLSPSVYAASEPETQQTIRVETVYDSTPIQGIPIQIYKLGRIDPDGTVNLADPSLGPMEPENPSTAAEWMNAAAVFAGRLQQKNEQPLLSGATGTDGTVSFQVPKNDTQNELYLLTGQTHQVGTIRYSVAPVLFTNWNTEDGVILIQAKLEKEPQGKTVIPPPGKWLPQTGEIVWPYYAASVLGLLCLSVALAGRRKRENRVLAVPALLLLSIALVGMGFSKLNAARAEEAKQKNLKYVETEIVWESGAERSAGEADQHPQETEPIETSPAVYAPVINGYIGKITVPELGIELPVTESWDYKKLDQAACCYYGDPNSPSMVIAAHSYATFFRPLWKAEEGQQVIFTNMLGIEKTYRICEVEVVKPDEVERMVQTDYALTLFTCTKGGQARCTVRCVPEDAV